MYMPEHISGTGAPITTGMEPTVNGRVDVVYDPVFRIPEETINSIFESEDYITMMDRFAEQYHLHNGYESDPLRQIKTLRGELEDIATTMIEIKEENNRRSQREQYIICGLVAISAITLYNFFRN